MGRGHNGNRTKCGWGWDMMGMGMEQNGTEDGTQWKWDTMGMGIGHTRDGT